MRSPFAATLALAGLSLLTAPAGFAQPAAPAAAAPPLSARVIVQFKADSPLLRQQVQSAAAQHGSRAAALGQRLGMSLRSGGGFAERMQVLQADGMGSAALAAKLRTQADVEFAVPDAAPSARMPGAERSLLSCRQQPPRPGRRPVVPAPARQHDAGRRSTPRRLGRSPPARRASWSRYSTPACATTIPTSPASCCPATTSSPASSPPTTAMAATPTRPTRATGSRPSACGGGKFAAASRAALARHARSPGWSARPPTTRIGMASVGRDVTVLPVRVLGKCGGYDSDILAAMRWAAGLPSRPACPPIRIRRG